jgi:hypothetical protein
MDNSEAKDKRRLKRGQIRKSTKREVERERGNLEGQELLNERSMDIIAGIHVFKKGHPMKKSVVAREREKGEKDERSKRNRK